MALSALAALAGAACRQDMHDQPRLKPLGSSEFFEDGRASRQPVAGTVARGQLREDRVYHTGIDAGGAFVTELPVPFDRALLDRGRQRYDIFCSPCHDRTGSGRGMIVRRGFKQPVSFHTDRLRGEPVGHFFDVMTRGFGQMSSYASLVPPEDRWAIAAYIRALQLSQHATVSEIAESDRREVETAGSEAVRGEDAVGRGHHESESAAADGGSEGGHR